VESRYITVDLGRAEAIMPPTEQSPFERYRPGQQLKFFVARVERTQRGPEIVVSRTHPDLLRRLFEVEVPEIFNGVVEIKAIAREPGSRSKVAVSSNQQGVDAVGACVGLRGIRIQNVVNELLGEKIDVIEWDDDPAQFIANSLSPAVVDRVDLDDDQHSAVVIVPDRQLSLAIGREGQNARLAAKLTNWRIDIQGASELAEREATVAVETAGAIPPVSAAEEQVEAEAVAATAPSVAAEPEAAPAKPAEREPVTVAESATEPVAAEVAAGSSREEAELLALEEELAALEREEADRKAAEEQRREAEVLDVSSDDLWQVDSGDHEPAEAGAIRFAEDIAGFRERDEGRRRRGGNRGGGARRGGGRR
jgi:N utilization substance protein A